MLMYQSKLSSWTLWKLDVLLLGAYKRKLLIFLNSQSQQEWLQKQQLKLVLFGISHPIIIIELTIL